MAFGELRDRRPAQCDHRESSRLEVAETRAVPRPRRRPPRRDRPAELHAAWKNRPESSPREHQSAISQSLHTLARRTWNGLTFETSVRQRSTEDEPDRSQARSLKYTHPTKSWSRTTKHARIKPMGITKPGVADDTGFFRVYIGDTRNVCGHLEPKRRFTISSKCPFRQSVFVQQLEVADQSFSQPLGLDVQTDLDVSLLAGLGEVCRRYKHLFGIDDDTFGVQR